MTFDIKVTIADLKFNCLNVIKQCDTAFQRMGYDIYSEQNIYKVNITQHFFPLKNTTSASILTPDKH